MSDEEGARILRAIGNHSLTKDWDSATLVPGTKSCVQQVNLDCAYDKLTLGG
jgi:hypothetical protein